MINSRSMLNAICLAGAIAVSCGLFASSNDDVTPLHRLLSDEERWVLAETKTEQDPLREEFIRVQIAKENLREDDPQRFEYEAREVEILAQVDVLTWIPAQIRKLLTEFQLEHISYRNFKRGFFYELNVSPSQWLGAHEAILTSGITSLTLQVHDESEASVAGSALSTPAMQNIEELFIFAWDDNWTHPRWDVTRLIQAVKYAPRLRNLKKYRFTSSQIIPIKSVADSNMFSSIEDFDFEGITLLEADWIAIANSPSMRNMRRLRAAIGLKGAEALANATHLSKLEDLDLSFSYTDGFQPLASSRVIRKLKRLKLRYFSVIDTLDSLKAMLSSPHLPRLAELTWDGNIGDEGVQEIFSAPRLQNLEKLNLESVGLTEAGMKSLEGSESLRKLKSLSLRSNQVTRRGYAAALRFWEKRKAWGLVSFELPSYSEL